MAIDSFMDLVEIRESEYGTINYMVYSTEHNFTGKIIYGAPSCYLHKEAAEKLKFASHIADSLGYKLKIYDAFRPLEAQKTLWAAVPDDKFVADPYAQNPKLAHCRGTAVDLILVDQVTDQELDMGTGVDTMSPDSYSDAVNLDAQALANRMTLCGIMSVSGFRHLPSEWWHYELPDFRDKLADGTDKYPIILGADSLVGGIL